MRQTGVLNFSLGVQIIRQGKRFVAYTPVLDLSTSGRTEKEAQKRFEEAVNLFFEEIINAGTFEGVLGGLGWEKVKNHWQPPQVVSERNVNLKVPVFV